MTQYFQPFASAHVAPVFISILFAYLYCIFLALTCIQSHCTVHAWWSSLCTLNCCMHLSSPSFELLQSCTGINSLSLITWLHYWSIFFFLTVCISWFIWVGYFHLNWSCGSLHVKLHTTVLYYFDKMWNVTCCFVPCFSCLHPISLLLQYEQTLETICYLVVWIIAWCYICM